MLSRSYHFLYPRSTYYRGTDSFTCCEAEGGYSITTTNVVTKYVGRFGNLWSASTRDLTPPSKKFRWLSIESKP